MRFRRRAEEDSAPVEAVFAGVLDGRRLWVAVPARPGRLALRPSGGGDPLDLPADAPEQPGFLSARIDLASLPPASYDVVVAGPDGVAPASTPPLPPQGRRRHRLHRTDDGRLVLRTHDVEPALELVSATAGPDGISVEVEGPEGRATLTADDLLAPGRPAVRRRDDDLPDPGRGAPLPTDDRVRLRWSPEGLLVARAVDA